MEMILFCGLQGAGKTTFYNANFASTHLRINLDMLRTRRRQGMILDACLRAGQRFVVDNTNPNQAERALYLTLAKAAHFKATAYYFDVAYDVALRRNNKRTGKAVVPENGLRATKGKLEKPTLAEGFSSIYSVDEEGEAALIATVENEI